MLVPSRKPDAYPSEPVAAALLPGLHEIREAREAALEGEFHGADAAIAPLVSHEFGMRRVFLKSGPP